MPTTAAVVTRGAHRNDLRLHRRIRDEDLLQAGEMTLSFTSRPERTMRSSSAKTAQRDVLTHSLVFSGPTK